MKKTIYFLLLAVSSCGFISCDDNDDDKQDNGTSWNYERPYFEFEYATDTVKFGQMEVAVKDLKQSFLGMATEKMKDYFKGIDFYSADTLLIRAQLASGEPINLHAGYTKNEKHIEVKLKAEDLAALTGSDKMAMIPAISFNYLVDGNQMTIYFDEVYVQTIFATETIQKMILPILANTLNPQFGNMPEQDQQRMLAALRDQITGILENIQKLRIGFVLAK